MTATAKPDASLERIAQGLETARANWQAFLSLVAKFPRYSFTNTVLIFQQCPNASLVQGFTSWKKAGRYVKKGEQGIQIFAPRVKKDDDGHRDVRGFHAVYVFDVAQTDGEPLPANMPTMTSDGEDATARAHFATLQTWLLETHACPVTLTHTPGCDGLYRRDTHRIEIEPNTGDICQFGTLVHETAHALLHRTDADREGLTRDLRELEAESVTVIVCERFGIPRAGGLDYLAAFNATPEGVRRHGERIVRTAQAIIKALEPRDDASESEA
jgi:N-terminal domain of anti-restriction factor ArdC